MATPIKPTHQPPCDICKERGFSTRGEFLCSKYFHNLCAIHSHLGTCCKRVVKEEAAPAQDNVCVVCKSKFIYYDCMEKKGKMCALHAHLPQMPTSCCRALEPKKEEPARKEWTSRKVDEPAKPSYCTMCESEFTEMTTTHRYQTCPYYNGCKKCGSSSTVASHVKKCTGYPSFMSNYCSMCEEKYAGSNVEHRQSCPYYTGCPFCHQRYFATGHLRKCKEKALSKDPQAAKELNESASRMSYRCDVCNRFIDSMIWDVHVELCTRRKTVMAAVVSARDIPEDKTWCSLCGEDILSRYFDKHVEHCKKRMAERFGRTGRSTAGEPDLVDDRPMPDEKVVKFKEEET